MQRSVYRVYSPRPERKLIPAALIQVAVALVGGMALFIAFAIALVFAMESAYSGRIYPGVSTGGVNLAGLTRQQAAERLASQMRFPEAGKLVLQDGNRVWVLRPADLGLSFDPQANALAAYQYGRSGNPFTRLAVQFLAWRGGQDVPVTLLYDEKVAQTALAAVAMLVDMPVKEASLSVNGVQVSVVPGQIGRRVDTAATLSALQTQIRSLTDGVVPLVVVETRPAVLDASLQADQARKLLAGPLTLTLPDPKQGDPGPWIIPPEQLAKWVVIEKAQVSDGQQYQVGLSDQALHDYLHALEGQVNRTPANARFTFNDDTRKLEAIQPSATGRSLNVDESIQEIKQKLAGGQRSVGLKVAYEQPQVADTATGEQLGITEQIASYTSYFRGSTAERLQNIQTAAANFHGLLVPPGATFSMADKMGDVSLDSGYAEAWIIYGGRTIKGVGGGVCQVSTTLFRTAFLAGFPIVERHPHAYRVGYYEQTATGYNANMAGLDATVFLPLVDFKFVNNTTHWLLMETYFRPNSRSLTWKFYSTSDGRKVEWNTSGPQNIVPSPDPVYEENPDLAKGQIKQVDWAAEGADITVTRTVYLNGQVLLSDSFDTHYMPWGDVYQYGPGTKLKQTPSGPKLHP